MKVLWETLSKSLAISDYLSLYAQRLECLCYENKTLSEDCEHPLWKKIRSELERANDD
jgi:hypothetical protein